MPDCILLDMPKKGVEWDEDLFVVLIDSYGKAGIVREAVKIFNKMKELGVERSVKCCDALFEVILWRGNKMKELGVDRSVKSYDALFKVILRRYKAGDLNANAYVLEAMVRLSIPIETGHYGLLIENLCEAEVYDQAVNLSDKFVEERNYTKTPENPDAAFEILRIMCMRWAFRCANSYNLLIKSYLTKDEPSDGKTIAALKILDFCLGRDCNIRLCEIELYSENHNDTDDGNISNHEICWDNSVLRLEVYSIDVLGHHFVFLCGAVLDFSTIWRDDVNGAVGFA
ncbi:hypothetical protein FEM48_Zijuj11G0074000 [Ziziphus jujuba var. spinosa]|uniref:Pentatricopeptide repeat-containing protein n=1 Tax=Ziziphus jujuba var. spinosa TaxID=714518 RepID=A0A978UHL8_ZIZJJ|nr:hypothetical protein FEM48_Zijuj11G0074000 [Ziziphus jujuba var. spinosa]